MGTGRGRSGRPWERIKARIQRDTTHCWRCGTPLDGITYKWPHPLSVTVGHIVALEDCAAQGIDPEDESNLSGECIRCNTRDGAHRTNRHRRGQAPTQRISYTDPNY